MTEKQTLIDNLVFESSSKGIDSEGHWTTFGAIPRSVCKLHLELGAVVSTEVGKEAKKSHHPSQFPPGHEGWQGDRKLA